MPSSSAQDSGLEALLVRIFTELGAAVAAACTSWDTSRGEGEPSEELVVTVATMHTVVANVAAEVKAR